MSLNMLLIRGHCGKIFNRRWTHKVHQPVDDFLNQSLLIDELLLRVDLRLNLLQIPVHHRTLLQLLLLFSCEDIGHKAEYKL